MTEERDHPGQHFIPFFGMAGGAIISFGAMLAVDDHAPSELVLLGRLHALITAMIFWALSAAWFQGREIHGGGVKLITSDRRSVKVGVPLLVLWALSLIAFVDKSTCTAWALSFALMAAFCGEVGWKDPFYLLKMFNRPKA